MSKKTLFIIGAISVIIIVTTIFFIFQYKNIIDKSFKNQIITQDENFSNIAENQNISDVVDTSGWKTYTNDKFNFMVQFPDYAVRIPDDKKFYLVTEDYTEGSNIEQNQTNLFGEPYAAEKKVFFAGLGFVDNHNNPDYKSIETGFNIFVYDTSYENVDEWAKSRKEDVDSSQNISSDLIKEYENSLSEDLKNDPEIIAEINKMKEEIKAPKLTISQNKITIDGRNAIEEEVKSEFLTTYNISVMNNGLLYKINYQGILPPSERNLDSLQQEQLKIKYKQIFDKISESFRFINGN